MATPAPIAAALAAVSAALPAYGWTDLQVATELTVLARGRRPLVVGDNDAYSITADGRAVLAGAADRGMLAAVDAWIGGVRLSPDRLWRYDAVAGRLVAPA